MKWLILVVFAAAGAARIPSAVADTESTVTCKDGTTSKGGKGACSHHGGVAPGAMSAPAPSAAPSNAPAAKPSSAPPASTPMVKCKDGSESKGGKGACSHHGGVASGEPGETAPPAGAAPSPGPQGRSAPASAPSSSRPSSSGAPAQPGQATAKCKDGSTSFSTHHSGACSHHGGVAQWLQ
jgi:hypothetical protein